MSLGIHANRLSFDLPDDLFSEGEVKPTRPAKKKATTNGTNGTKKRSASDVCEVGLTRVNSQ